MLLFTPVSFAVWVHPLNKNDFRATVDGSKILHQWIGLSYYLRGFIHPRWFSCRISEPSKVLCHNFRPNLPVFIGAQSPSVAITGNTISSCLSGSSEPRWDSQRKKNGESTKHIWHQKCKLLELQTTSFLWLFQLDDEPNHYIKNGWKSPNIHPLKRWLFRVLGVLLLVQKSSRGSNSWYGKYLPLFLQEGFQKHPRWLFRISSSTIFLKSMKLCGEKRQTIIMKISKTFEKQNPSLYQHLRSSKLKASQNI